MTHVYLKLELQLHTILSQPSDDMKLDDWLTHVQEKARVSKAAINPRTSFNHSLIKGGRIGALPEQGNPLRNFYTSASFSLTSNTNLGTRI